VSRGWFLLAFLGLAASVFSCSKDLTLPVVLNQPPTLRLTQAPTDSGDPTFYAYELFWSAFDPDGAISHYLYAVDPPTERDQDTLWVRTTENRIRVLFRSDQVDSIGPVSTARGYHVFVIKAVDDRGAASAVLAQGFTTYTVAPTVRFVSPVSDPLFAPNLPPVSTIQWEGDDPDGQSSRRPVKYKYRLFPESSREFSFLEILLRPDSLRRRFAPTFSEWDSVSGDTTSITLRNLVPNTKYIFAVVAFDEAGAYSPVFSFDHNLLYFTCTYSAREGPRLTIANQYFSYTYDSGGYDTDPARIIHVEFPAEQPIRMQWSATPHPTTTMRGYRWAVDIERLEDESPRTNENTDFRHWSTWSLGQTIANLGSYTGVGADGESDDHIFYIEAEDANGLRSLGMVQFRIVRPSFEKDLLFVDDTRFAPDTRSPGSDSVRAPSGNWPSAAELDTFLFAVGGVRWRYMPGTTQSRPGVFKGYGFDTLDTRATQGNGITLSALARYRNVVWYTDRAVTFLDPMTDTRKPMTMMRRLHSSSGLNVLAIYAGMGGNLWLMGGGVAYNTLASVNLTGNDVLGTVFSSTTDELRPGRTMYDMVRWRSEILCGTSRTAARSVAAVGGWPGAPDYSLLPPTLNERTSATDPLPPVRGITQYYLRTYESEVLTLPNYILEDVDPDPYTERLGSPIDTLYDAVGADPTSGLPTMTYYHGPLGGKLVFSGFPLWYFQRSQVLALGDFVLQRIFGLSREPVQR
jgi:hypothetical protein